MLPFWCPYCLRSSTEVEFSRGHIIPQSIGGLIWIPQCKDCNSLVGSRCEGALVHVREINDARDAMPGAVRSRLGEIRPLREKWITKDGHEVPPHRPSGLPDGSLIIPEERTIPIVRTRIERDKQVASDQDIKRAFDDVRAGPAGSVVRVGSTDHFLRWLPNHIASLKEWFSPPSSLLRVALKIAFEFMFFRWGPGAIRAFLADRSQPIHLESLWNCILALESAETGPHGLIPVRQLPSPDGGSHAWRPRHGLRLRCEPWSEGMIACCDVGLFEGVQFTCTLGMSRSKEKWPTDEYVHDLDGERQYFRLESESVSEWIHLSDSDVEARLAEGFHEILTSS